MKDYRGREVVFAATTVVDALAEYINPILAAITEVMDFPEGPCFVSDESNLSDFCETPQQAGWVGEKLGIPIYADDSLVDMAIRLRDKEPSL